MHQYTPQAILCVDDHEEAWALAKEAFGDHEVVIAPDGYTAVCRMNERPFDLYLTEYWLPDWSGTSLCRQIRKMDAHVPVCFVTAAGRTAHEQRARRAGAADYMLKPLDASTLRLCGLKLLQHSEFANVAALERARRAAAKEIERRFASMDGSVSLKTVENALQRVVRSAALTAFLQAGGTLAGFDRSWGDLWQASRRSGGKVRAVDAHDPRRECVDSDTLAAQS